ncbi:DinB family protein [Psychromicrobium xiongbiense]|uniref:DinB family protein n=1 Tax=Psychromicrobium xiongbiense TaxID=3051184 RepID=UPI002555C9AD|nr:DinB family protein [Psychromicrobium sp. YIM S02556]
MAIIPETKDWTWVLERPCPECGFEAGLQTPTSTAATLPGVIERWEAVLRRADLTVRPDDATWSPLEYACHVRDVFSVMDTRLHTMLTRDEPTFANWDQDATAVDYDYAHQVPQQVSDQLTIAGGRIGERFGAVPPEDWERFGHRSDGATFTVRSLSGYFLHDVVHHLHDVQG